MSEERKNDISDPVVSDLYRESATERAPASLNETVLRNAAAHADKGYAHSMLWMRPLAYAATVVLSLAIVVQFLLPQDMDADVPAASTTPMADAAEVGLTADLVDAPAGPAAEDDDPLKRLRDQEVREESKIEEFAVPVAASEAVPEVAEQRERIDADSAGAIEEVAVQGLVQTAPETEDLESAALSSAMAIQEASEMAALRSVQPGDYAVSASLTAGVESSVCEPEDIESPETWAECIERLEEAGRIEEAVAERMLLTEAFPDFEWPGE